MQVWFQAVLRLLSSVLCILRPSRAWDERGSNWFLQEFFFSHWPVFSTVACRGHSISWSLSLLQVYKQTRNFEFTNTKFRVYKLEKFEFALNTKFRVCKLEISSLQTRNFQLINSKFQVYKLEISSLQTQNFEFVNSKQRKWSRNRMSLTSHRSFPFTVKAAKTFFSQIFIPHPSKVNLSAPILASSADNSSWYFRQRIQAAKTGSEEFEWVGERRSHVDFCHSLLYPH